MFSPFIVTGQEYVMKTLYVFVAAVVICTTVWAADPYIYTDVWRRPTDTDVDLFINDWHDSVGHIGHGGFVEQEYFYRGDPHNPTRKGAVLKYIKEYNHGILGPMNSTVPTKHDKEQVLFYILSGVGTVEAGGKTVPLAEGTGVFIPAGLTYSFKNTGPESIQAIIIVEEIPDDFKPIKEMKTGNYHNRAPSYGIHWCHVGYGLVDGVKFYNPMGIGVVSIASFDVAQPHAHVEGAEEIWTQIRGESLLLIGKHIRRQPVGTSFLAPPDSASAHASINPTDEPVYWLYLGNRYDGLKK